MRLKTMELLNTLLLEPGFRLSGSRYFASRGDGVEIMPGTDWDFSCLDSADNRELLDRLGFRIKKGE